jgi:DNA-binding transcriptional LysR family regulator
VYGGSPPLAGHGIDVVAVSLAVGVLPLQLGPQYAQFWGIGMVPLSDPWAKRRFAVCFRDYDGLAPAAQNLVDHMVTCAV